MGGITHLQGPTRTHIRRRRHLPPVSYSLSSQHKPGHVDPCLLEKELSVILMALLLVAKFVIRGSCTDVSIRRIAGQSNGVTLEGPGCLPCYCGPQGPAPGSCVPLLSLQTLITHVSPHASLRPQKAGHSHSFLWGFLSILLQ